MAMYSDEIFDVIEQIANTSSKNDKKAILEKYLQDVDFKMVIRWALDPFITFGIAKVPKRAPFGGGEHFDNYTFELLNNLEERKLTGGEARSWVKEELDELTEKSAELLTRILTKDLRAGFSAKTVNAVLPNTIPSFECMLAHPFKKYSSKVKYPVAAELKLDGIRVLALVRPYKPSVEFFTRSGIEITSLDHLKEEFIPIGKTLGYEGVMFDGEVVSGSFFKTASDIRKKGVKATDAVYYAFDVMPIGDFISCGNRKTHPWSVRQGALTKCIDDTKKGGIRRLPNFIMKSEEEVYDLYNKVRDRGFEGVVIKDMNGLYTPTRSPAWLKIKAEESEDLRILGAFEGTGKYVGMLGGFIVDREGTPVNVGGGFSDEERETFWKIYQVNPDDLKDRICEVLFHEVTPDGSLRHPRYKRMRDTIKSGVKE
jgi:DNA ligase-1